jgi:hypothetical protein
MDFKFITTEFKKRKDFLSDIKYQNQNWNLVKNDTVCHLSNWLNNQYVIVYKIK